MTQKVSSKEARGIITPTPDNTAPVPPEAPHEQTVEPVKEPEAIETEDFHSGRMTKFTPAMDFTGYPDGTTKTAYSKDVEAEAPANYVKLLKKIGRTA